jgi:hypothetical protein
MAKVRYFPHVILKFLFKNTTKSSEALNSQVHQTGKLADSPGGSPNIS